ncbi:CDP-6-deoxy-delta-3,4-glucoseen reductase [Inhella gelatinilytica]|uniref:CDP-6-deoxy-delta-3,4-glucoseen reductase n=1 Tax=Inhella gelatinilytica TaxID=2795030 RepID=A0A931NE48_9BURK|nr:CDP-6-deoxy-delta-3,4-glucoseen reductase [Inhella gelatinilytica]MBH9553787.1 CDP-6-deoxy-delta-3,4-glucoseen reductase [Inhella gelatinilytica]
MSLTVTVQPAGRTLTVARDTTILSAAIAQGIALPYGCKDGACGSCKCRLVEGRVIHGVHQQKALSDAEEAAGLILTCCATPQTDCVLEARTVPAEGAHPVLKMPVRVVTAERAAADVLILRLQLPANQSFQYHAGQYLEFILRDGSRRAYSMATAPGALENQVDLHIRHMPGGKFTDHAFSALKERDILRAEGPFGSFFLRKDSNKPMVFLASGTGFAPIKALIEQLEREGNARPVTLYWGGRRPADLYLSAWVDEARARLSWLRYVPVCSDALAEDGWNGRTGFVHQAVLQDQPDLSGHEVYACGAPIVVDSARRDYTQAGLPEDCFYADAFTSEADKHGA